MSALTTDGTTIFAGGSFTMIGGQTRNRLAAIDLAGTVLAWNPNLNGTVNSLAVQTGVVYAGGNFGTVGTVTPPLSRIERPLPQPTRVAPTMATTRARPPVTRRCRVIP